MGSELTALSFSAYSALKQWDEAGGKPKAVLAGAALAGKLTGIATTLIPGFEEISPYVKAFTLVVKVGNEIVQLVDENKAPSAPAAWPPAPTPGASG